MTWGGGALPALLHAVDGDCALGSEILDEAIASLVFRIDAADVDAYGDGSYDEDRRFVRDLKARGATLARLPPGAPAYVHVKHAAAAARGPLTDLHAAGLGFLASPLAAAAAVAVAAAGLRAVAHAVT